MPLNPDELIILKHILMIHEGIKLFPYLDCCGKSWRNCQCSDRGKLTIGIGRNLDDFGITESEIEFLLLNNISQVTAEIEKNFSSWYKKLNSPRKIVIISMVFNLGIVGFKSFDKLIKCIESGDFSSASNQMLTSKWARQVGDRALELAKIMRTGEFNV